MKGVSWIIGIAALFIGGNYFVENVVKKKKDEVIESVIKDDFSEDILFLSELLPIFCDNQEKASELFYIFQNHDEEGEFVDFAKKGLAIFKKIPRKLDKMKANNLFQQKLKDDLVQVFKRNPIGHLSVERMMKSEEIPPELEILGSDLKIVFEESNIEEYLENKFKKLTSGKYSIIEQASVGAFFEMNEKQMDSKTARVIISSIHDVAMQNESYQKYYEGGCLNILKNEAEMALINLGNTDK